MNDDIFERFIKSIGIVFGGFLVLYLTIVTTQKPPRGIALKIVLASELLAKGFFYMALVVGISLLIGTIVNSQLTKKQIKKEKEERIERERHTELLYLKKEIESLKRKLEDTNDEKRKYVVALHEEQARRLEFENHLKNRTAQAAVTEALGHFL